MKKIIHSILLGNFGLLATCQARWQAIHSLKYIQLFTHRDFGEAGNLIFQQISDFNLPSVWFFIFRQKICFAYSTWDFSHFNLGFMGPIDAATTGNLIAPFPLCLCVCFIINSTRILFSPIRLIRLNRSH